MPSHYTLSEHEISKQAQGACSRHPYGFEVASPDNDLLSGKPGFSVPLAQPVKPATVEDKEWWDVIAALRNEIEQIEGVDCVYIIYAERQAASQMLD